MDLERAFTFIWKDEEWIKKAGIAFVLMLTTIGSIGVIGWIAELAKRVAQGDPEPIPNWDQMGEYFKIGLKYLGIAFIWSLPVLIGITGTALLMTPSVMMEDPGPFLAMVSIFNICMSVFAFIYIMIINLLTPPLWVLLAEGEPFNEMIKPKHAWKLFRSNSGGYLIAMLVGWLITAILSSFGALACLVGVFFTSVLSQMIVGFLVGQATSQARANIEINPVPLV
jgi:hypothetical protein